MLKPHRLPAVSGTDPKPATPERRYLSLAEVADRIGRKRKTLYKWVKAGVIGFPEGLHLVRGRYLVDWPVFEARVVKPRIFNPKVL
jgi:predicted DNA-binding transcriptional regulator AlpA